jgi:hypothetical protein
MGLAAATLHPSSIVDDFAVLGYHEFGQTVDPSRAAELLAKIRTSRAFDHRLFLSEAEFDRDPQYVGVNPRPGRNLLERHAADLDFVERNFTIAAGLTELLGPGYQILDRKIVCGVPAQWTPEWVRRRIIGNPVNNLGAYVRPEFRDVTYFYGIDFHQDLIDFRGRDADFVTLYIYLHDVGPHDAPLFLLERSHRLGATVFPHELTQLEDGWLYADGPDRRLLTRQKMLTGPGGYAAVWHACTLHGTQPDAADKERLSLRYLLAKKSRALAGIDEVNARLEGPVRLSDTRRDLDAAGATRLKANSVNSA